MSIQYYMDYVIFFSDPAEYTLAVSIAGSNLLKMAPRDAATLFGIPFPYPSGDMDSIPKGIYFLFPFTVGSQIGFPGPSGVFVDDTVLTVNVPAQAGTPASTWPADPTKNGLFTWSGNITKSKGAGSSVTPPVTNISQRRWIGGREQSNFLEGGSGIDDSAMIRDSSRTIDGLGLPIRGNHGAAFWNKKYNDHRAGFPTTAWERFYVRLRNNPTVNECGIWRIHSTTSNLAGWALKITTAGGMKLVAIDAINTETSKGVIFTPTQNVWFRVDCFISGDGDGITHNERISVYVNGVNLFNNTDGSIAGTTWNNSDLGKYTGVDAEIEVDLDDWMAADLPSNVNTTSLTFNDSNFPIDWLLGSHIRYHPSVSISQTNWTPAGSGVGITNQGVSQVARQNTSDLVSTTSGATLEGLTDAPLQSVRDSIANVLGAVAAIIGLWSRNSVGTDGKLGYRKAGAAAVTVTVDQLAADSAVTAPYLPTGMAIPDEISPWSHTHTKSVDGNTDTTSAMGSVVEYLGVWGPEDDPAFNFPISRLTFLHNSRYPNTVWGYVGSQPVAPVYAVGGTYVGNGTYQEITLPGACQFLWIRATAGGSGPISLFGGAVGAHLGAKEATIPNVRMWFDSSANLFKFSVDSTNVNINQAATTYQYIAFCDPGMRYSLSGAFAHGSSAATPKVNALIAPDFLPICGFAVYEYINAVSANLGMFFKGPANAANQITPLDGSAVPTTGMNFSTGVVNSFATLHSGGSGGLSTAYMLWRMLDSGADGCTSNVMIQILTYTGNGAGGTRNIALTPVSGRFPLFVLVVPNTNAASFFRDPSHTVNDSANVNTLANSTTAITATAIDQITIGVTLNANLVVYNVFVICGDVAGMNNGTYIPAYCGGDGPYIAPATPIGDIIAIGNGGLVLDGTPGITAIKDASGLYTLVVGQAHDQLIDRNTTPASTLNVKIPDPTWKTGYLGG